MVRVLVLTRYDTLGASSRVRMLQYLPFLDKQINFTVSPFFSNTILESFYSNNGRSFLQLISRYLKRISILRKQNQFDYIWVEKEVLPFFPGFLEVLFLNRNSKYILDYDDAIFHNYDLNPNFLIRFFLSNKLKPLIRNAYHICVGNTYLKSYVQRWNNKVSILYSLVNENEYYNVLEEKHKEVNCVKIGWIGSPSTTKYLHPILNILNKLATKYKLELVTIGADNIPQQNFPITQLVWNLKLESIEISNFDIGIMPLFDSPWERGKCGFKLIQYMSCGLPVIASPIGVNKYIVNEDVGYLADNESQWEQALELLIKDNNLRIKLGKNGRKRIESHFSFSGNLDKINLLFLKNCLN